MFIYDCILRPEKGLKLSKCKYKGFQDGPVAVISSKIKHVGIGRMKKIFAYFYSFFVVLFLFLSRPSSAFLASLPLRSWLDHWGTFCAGGLPISISS